MGYVLRVEMNDGGKFTPQVTWAVPADGPADADPLKVGRWCLTPMADPRPLYHAERLAKEPDKPVIVVMGEKKADALQKVLKDRAVVVSWAGGDNGRPLTDFGPLKCRDVTIWPDADRSGKTAAVGEVAMDGKPRPGVCHYANIAGAANVKVIVPPQDVEKGWDAGDMVASGAGREQIEAFIIKTAVEPNEARREFERQEHDRTARIVQPPEHEQTVGIEL